MIKLFGVLFCLLFVVNVNSYGHEERPAAKVLTESEGGYIYLPATGEEAYFKLYGSETYGAYTLVDDYYLPGGRVGRHLHKEHAETFYISKGKLKAIIGDEEPFIALPGTMIHVPRGTPHGFEAINERVKVHMIYAPGGLLEDGAFSSEKLTKEELSNPRIRKKRAKKYDIVPLKE